MAKPRHCVELTGVTVAYDGEPILTDIHWQVPCGTMAAIIGPNGGGKSTLLRTLVGMLQPNAGTVRVFGKQPQAARRSFAYLPQSEEIDWRFPIRVLDVVLQGKLHHEPWWRFPSGRAGKSSTGHAADEALAALDRVALADKAWQPVGELSGGQKQRVLLAKALVQDAQLILLDEPATALDATAQHDLLDILDELKAEGRTIVATTHDLDCLADHFDTVLGLRRQVIAWGPPARLLTPEFFTTLFGRHTPLLMKDGRVTMVEHMTEDDGCR